MFTVAVLAIAVVALGTLTWALNSRWAGERDWVYNRYNPRPPGMGTLGLLEEIYEPSIRYVVEERSSQKARGSQDESGEDSD